MIDDPAKELIQQSAGTEQVVQSASRNAGATPLAMGLSTPIEVQGEDEVETEVAMETSTATQEELAMAVPSTHSPCLSPIYSTTVIQFPTPIPAIANCKAIFPNTTLISNAIWQCPHLSLTERQEDLEQSTQSARTPISCPIVAPIQPFNIQWDPADMVVLRKKSGDAQEMQKNILLEARQPNLNVSIVAALEREWHDDSAMAVTKLLQKQLQGDRERRMTRRRNEVMVPSRHSSLLSTTPSVGSPAMATMPSTIHISWLSDQQCLRLPHKHHRHS